MPLLTQTTAFTRDAAGRYVCNTFQEAKDSADTALRPDARPFDVIIIGGGTFGAAVAQHLFANDVSRSHRILVLEGGPFLLPEHTQNVPMIGLFNADPTSVAAYQAMTANQKLAWEKEVWGIPWHSSTPFPGLAYCLGGRSLYWGGWSPELLSQELPTAGAAPWPTAVVGDLTTRYFREASNQIGVSQTNDFIYGPLHFALRQRLFDGIASVSEAFPLTSLPDHPAVRFSAALPSDDELKNWLGIPATNPTPARQAMLNLMKLEAPLAVESVADAGRFPINKFSSVPLLIKAARQAQTDSGGDDVQKRLMVVPFCHVNKLQTSAGVVTSVETNLGPIPVVPGAVVIIALGTIESARLALNSFQGVPSYPRMGQNLLAHLRSNLTIRIPRSSLVNAAGLPKALSTSALFLKGTHTGPDRTGTFHLQITASGIDATGTNSEAELWQKIPDIDTLNGLRNANDDTVVITIRGIAEMEPNNPASFVRLDPDTDFGMPRAFVAIAASPGADDDLWNAMDAASDQVAKVFANGQPFEVLLPGGGVSPAGPGTDLKITLPYRINRQGQIGRRDNLGTTHHEAGTLRMGASAADSVTNADLRFHDIPNAYVLGPALFPTIGSPNPMLTGIALSRRLADHLIPPPPPMPAEAGFLALFDGTAKSYNQWKFVGQGAVLRAGRALVTQPGNDLGLFYFPQTFGDFTLRLHFMLPHPRGANNDNSGVFVRFLDPTQPVPDPNNPGVSYPYNNQAYVAVDTGFEVQIDEEARGNLGLGEGDGLPYNHTGAIYKITSLGTFPGQQNYQNGQVLAPGQWHDYEIQVTGNTYTVLLNGQPCTTFINNIPFRGQSPGYIGLQTHTGRVAFANIRIK
jgi:choline dehydrogenase-like flavoprotein